MAKLKLSGLTYSLIGWLFWLMIFLIAFLVRKSPHRLLDALVIASAVLSALCLLVLVWRWGFLERSSLWLWNYYQRKLTDRQNRSKYVAKNLTQYREKLAQINYWPILLNLGVYLLILVIAIVIGL
ncbi:MULTISPECIES: hypothetical protein [unclassified Mycoplasma]|uniref:hypothetical protein n=1 Tax=unclassified Mycoplasma TaxID=2683645 RepID=UPI000FDDFB77